MNKTDFKKTASVAGKVLAVTAAAAGAAAFIIAPGRASKESKAPFMGRNIAHRGLHRRDKSVPENSLPAFEAAARIGYGIEFDVHITTDGQLVVFHDDTLDRVCGVGGRIDDMSWEELKSCRLCGTEYGIPLLGEVLSAIDGRSPIIVELKRGRNNRELCRLTYEALRDYNGKYCIESFDPGIVMWFRFHAPEVLRGQLSAQPEELAKTQPKPVAYALGLCLTNFLTRPQFIAYRIGKKPLTVRVCEALGAMKVAWTSLDWKNEEKNDTVIFQFYRPMVKFK